jgi:hypothetical protein
MDIKKLAEKMKAAKYVSGELEYCLVAQNYLSELLMNDVIDKVQKAMEQLEEQELDEERGKPRNLAEYKEYIGEN